jgi:hypothetical protein
MLRASLGYASSLRLSAMAQSDFTSCSSLTSLSSRAKLVHLFCPTARLYLLRLKVEMLPMSVFGLA